MGEEQFVILDFGSCCILRLVDEWRRAQKKQKGKRAHNFESVVLKQGSILQEFELVWGVDVTGVCDPSD